MITRRAVLIPLPLTLALGACSYCYGETELISAYRALRTLINETLTLSAEGAYEHAWIQDGQRVGTRGSWRAGCLIEFYDYVLPARGGQLSLVYFHGSPESPWDGRPRISSDRLEISFARVLSRR